MYHCLGLPFPYLVMDSYDWLMDVNSPNLRDNISQSMINNLGQRTREVSSNHDLHYGDVKMVAIASQITSLRIVDSIVIQTQIKENMKAPRHWPLCGEFTGDRWIPRTNGQLRGKCFHLMTSSCVIMKPMGYLSLTMPSDQHWNSHYKDKMVMRLSYLYNGNPCTQTDGLSIETEQRILGPAGSPQHDDIIKWKYFPRYWPFVRGIPGHPWIPRTKASDAELWCFLWYMPEQTVEQIMEMPVISDANTLIITLQ